MDYFESRDDVRCKQCQCHPENIEWDHHFDYDDNEKIHEYGRYTCKCGYWATFATNDPYGDHEEVSADDEE